MSTGKISQLHALAPKDITPRQVVSYEVSTLFGGIGNKFERYNPDDLATRKSLGIYSKMMDDEQVKAVMKFRAASITARGFEFKYEQDAELSPDEQETRIKFFQYNLEKLRGSFQDALNGILRGHQYGFSLTEKVFDVCDYDGRVMNCIAALLPRDPTWFRFFTDKYGTLDHIEQCIGSERLTVDATKFIHYVNAPEEDRCYGRSDLRAAHRPWYIKDVVTNLYATYLERFAGGFAWAELTPEANLSAQSPDYAALQDAMNNIRHMAALIMPPGVKLNIFQPGNSGEYREALIHCDLGIAKAVLVPNLLGLSHTGQTGAYSQSQTQLEAYFMTTAADATRLEDVLNEQLFKDLGDLNYADDQYPRFFFKPASQEHVKWIIDTWATLAGGGQVQTTEADEKHLRTMLEMPSRTEDDVLIKEENLKLDAKYAPKEPAVPGDGKAKFSNPNHEPPGSSKGGQFAPKDGGSDDGNAKLTGQPRAYLDQVHRRTVDDYNKHGFGEEDLEQYHHLAEHVADGRNKANMPEELRQAADDFLSETHGIDLDPDFSKMNANQRARADQEIEDYNEAAQMWMDIAGDLLSRKNNPSAFRNRQPVIHVHNHFGSPPGPNGLTSNRHRGHRGAAATRFINDQHEPAGSSKGGQFAPKGGGGEGGFRQKVRDSLEERNRHTIDTYQHSGYDPKDKDRYVALAKNVVRKGAGTNLASLALDYLRATVDVNVDSYSSFDNPQQQYDKEMKQAGTWFMGQMVGILSRDAAAGKFSMDFANPNHEPAGSERGGQFAPAQVSGAFVPATGRDSSSLDREDNAPAGLDVKNYTDDDSYKFEEEESKIQDGYDRGLDIQDGGRDGDLDSGYKTEEAVSGYRELRYSYINNYLRTGEGGEDQFDSQGRMDTLDAVKELQALSTGDGHEAIAEFMDTAGRRELTVYRGVFVHEGNDNEWFDTMQPGTEFVEPAFFSTSYKSASAMYQAQDRGADMENPGRVALFRVKVNKYTNGFLGNVNENEVVLNAGTKFRVLGRGKTFDDVEVIDLEASQ